MEKLGLRQSSMSHPARFRPDIYQTADWSDTLSALSDPSLAPLFWHAERAGSQSAWWEHVPFAHWLVCATAPRVLVELGTHTGVSYAAFCQAVTRAGLPTRCHAVDTWQGDPHAGIYGPEILGELRSFHDERYSAFSTLLQSTFDEALEHIEDGSIDLLHIDGLHTYEAVRHDFESWLPKLSDRAVVLFHDINVRQKDFGVWRLWDELRRQYPSFEFVHGYGLGVLAVGGDAPAPVVALCSLTDPAAITMIRTRFARFGEHWWVDTQHRILARDFLNREAAADAHAQSLQTEVERLRTEAETLRTAVARQNAEAEAMRVEMARQSVEAGALRGILKQRDGQVEESADRATALTHALTQVRAEFDGMRYSTAWRATWPARVVGQNLPSGLRRALRGSAKLCWWAVTMKLRRKLKQRQLTFEARRQTEAASATPPAVSTELPPSAAPASIADVAQVDASPKWLAPNPVSLQTACTVSMVRVHCAAWAPLPVFSDRRAAPTLTVLVDAVEAENLLGGVGTTLVVGVIAARLMCARLRLVTRQHALDPALLRETLDAHRVSWDGATDFVHMPVSDTRPLPLGDRDTILTASWWNTSAALGSVNAARVLYLLQEDERMFYPYGDSRLRCVETLREPNLPLLVNTRMLFDHFADGSEPLPNLLLLSTVGSMTTLGNTLVNPRIGRARQKSSSLTCSGRSGVHFVLTAAAGGTLNRIVTD